MTSTSQGSAELALQAFSKVFLLWLTQIKPSCCPETKINTLAHELGGIICDDTGSQEI